MLIFYEQNIKGILMVLRMVSRGFAPDVTKCDDVITSVQHNITKDRRLAFCFKKNELSSCYGFYK